MRAVLSDPGFVARTFTATFVGPVAAGSVELTAELEHVGRTVATVRARGHQGGELRVLASATFGRAVAGLARLERTMPDVKAPEHYAPLGTEPVPGSGGLGLVVRPALGALPLTGSPDARGAAWVRLADERPIDALSTIVLADSLVPALFLALDQYEPIPSVELVVHFNDLLAAEASPWALVKIDNVAVGNGWTTEDGELWTPTGQLIAVSRQLRHLPGERSTGKGAITAEGTPA
jgi:acyl-CoA thioesterase